MRQAPLLKEIWERRGTELRVKELAEFFNVTVYAIHRALVHLEGRSLIKTRIEGTGNKKYKLIRIYPGREQSILRVIKKWEDEKNAGTSSMG